MKQFLLLFILVLILPMALMSQTISIQCTVVDEKGDPVPGVSVTVKGTKTGTSADQLGKFNIRAQKGDVLILTGTSIETIEFKIEDEKVYTIVAKLKAHMETEVVVTTALGIKRQQRDLGYSTAQVKSDLLIQSAPVNAANGLQGKISGVNIATMNNSVFENVKINIRGIRSLTGSNDPLLVIDGVQTSLQYLSSLNPNDIIDITVLKGSSGAAIYGPDARNGVLLVTTKKGTKNNKTEVSLTQTFQYSKISFYPEFQEEFGSGGYGAYTPYENWSWGPAFDGSLKVLGSPLVDGTEQRVVYSPTDSRKKFFNTGVTRQTDLSVNSKDLYFSLQQVNIHGIVPGDENKRTGMRLNSSREFGRFKISANINYIRGDFGVFDNIGMGNYNAGQGIGLNSGLLNLIFNTPAQVPIKRYKDWKSAPFAGFDTYFNHYGHNPYMALETWRVNGRVDDLLSNLEMTYRPASSLAITWRVANTFRNENDKNISTGQSANAEINVNGNTSIPGYVSESSFFSNRLSSEFFGSYTKKIKDFKFNAIAGTYVRQSEFKSIGISNTALVVPGLYSVNNRSGEFGGGGGNFYSRTRLFSLFGSVSAGYSNWASIEFTGRNDKVSWLAEGNNSYFYPGLNAAVVLSDAIPRLKSKILSYAKLRFSWNRTMNADLVGPYELNATYQASGGFPYGTLPGYTASNNLTNPGIKPEKIETYEVGTELNFFRNKLSAVISYFKNNMSDQIIPVSVSRSTGFSTTKINSASFYSEGLELDITYAPVFKNSDWKLSFSGNATYNKSKVISIYPGLERIQIGGFANASNYAFVGKPAMTFMVKDYVRDSLGRIIVDRITGLPSANPNLTPMGRTAPVWVLGLTPSVSWKDFNLTIVAEYKGGHLAYGRIGNEMAWTGVSAATAYNHRERFVIPNSVYMDPASGKYIENKNVTINDITDFYTGVFRQAETNFMYSADSWRIREVSLSYQFPSKLFKRMNFINSAGITLNARNLFLWVPKSNQFTDPDFNFDGGNSNGVTTSSINPPVRTMGLTLDVKF